MSLQRFSLALIALALVACGAPRSVSNATLTAADAPASDEPTSAEPASTSPATSNASATPTAAPNANAPAGQLVCRTYTALEGTTELYVDWRGKEGEGLLRRQAPSGMVYEQPVKAERADNLVVVDRPGNEDLVAHDALVQRANGKQHMRVGDKSHPWAPCE